MGMPYDTERVAQLRNMLREARKRKLSAGLGERGLLSSPAPAGTGLLRRLA